MERINTQFILDVRGLEAPEPLERVLEALTELARGHALRVLISREPHPLYGILDCNGFRSDTHLNSLGHYEVLIQHKT